MDVEIEQGYCKGIVTPCSYSHGYRILVDCRILPHESTRIFKNLQCTVLRCVLTIMQTLTDEEQYAIGIIKKEGKMQASKLPYNALMSIYRKNLIHLHVPIEANDFIIGMIV